MPVINIPPAERALGDDTFYLRVTALLFGWEIAATDDKTVVKVRRGPCVLDLCFSGTGVFRYASASGQGAAYADLLLCEAVEMLESPYDASQDLLAAG